MSGIEINRRDFLKVMGWSGAGVALAACDMPSTITLEEGKEEVTAYILPEEYVIPGVGVYYASTCQQCSAGCGIHGRVREGRVLKFEGNPNAQINSGKLCQMGQGGVQAHYNPDRVTKPLVRKGGSLVEASWDEALGLIKQHVGPESALSGDKFAWVTGTVSGHQAVLLQAHLDAMGSGNHYVHEVINNAVGQAVNRDMLGETQPTYRFDEARIIVSFGADFLGTWVSPVHFATQYAKFREAPRGILVQIEPKMTLTGANADLWLAVRPGTEGVLALGIANALLVKHKREAGDIPVEVRDLIARYDLDAVQRITGVASDRIVKVAGWLDSQSPSLVLAGGAAEGQAHGYETAVAVMLLNIILGNVGRTIVSNGELPYAQMAPKSGNTQALLNFAETVEKGGLEAVFFYNTNPVYTAPSFLKLADKLNSVPFKVAFAQFPDETAMRADVVLPIHSPYEDWGTHVAAYNGNQIGVQQPLMEPLNPTTRGFGDLLLEMLKLRKAETYGGFADYYAYLKQAISALPVELTQPAHLHDAQWQQALQTGLIPVARQPRAISAKALAVSVPDYAPNTQYPYHLVPSPRLGLWDGRHANIPWLQEAPDQISKVVWDSWAEMHPVTAQKLGVAQGDVVTITSDQGAVEAKIYIYKGMHPDAIAVPLGQGHEAEFSRYAKDRGVNPLKILSPVRDGKTGELALYGTRVQITKAGRHEKLVKMGGSEIQVG
ncbi:MAG: molybdopterin-dependent oxidoreductase, partial [Pseudomonadota bacterium]